MEPHRTGHLLCPKLGVQHGDSRSGAGTRWSIWPGRAGDGEEWDCKNRVRVKEPGLGEQGLGRVWLPERS